jgi:hypothetical protein
MAPRRPPGPFDEALKGLSPDELRELASRVLDLTAFDRRPERVARRRPRSKHAFALTVRADLVDAEPSIWRRVELPSTLRLDQVHDLLQALFGWTDSHLHRFALGDTVWGDEAELFLCPYDVEEGEDEGVAASLVRLDEVLRDVGDHLLYVYDYGDGWMVRLEVEGVERHELAAPRVLDGQGAAPPDDSGGIHAWNEAGGAEPPLDLDAVRVAVDETAAEWSLPAPVVQLQRRLLYSPSYRQVVELVAASGLRDAPTAEDVTPAVRPYAWLLDRVGDGITLTQAGYLPPRDVLAAMTELELGAQWIGKGNREDQTLPVRELRLSAQRLGLLRVNKGRLLPTKAGTAVRGDLEGLARTVADKAGGLRRTAFQRELTAMALLVVSAGHSIDDKPWRQLVARALGELGWSRAGGGELEPWGLLWADEDTHALLTVMGCLGSSLRPIPPSAAAQAMARRVLLSLR